MDDAEIVGDEIEGYVSGLLGLVGIEADPLSSREHILLSNLIHHSWSAGQPLDLPTLVGLVGNPPIRKLGVFELDQFFPPDDRMKLAMQLNGLLASPSFAAWADGPPLDIQSMLYTADGRPRCAIVTTAHLSDDERQFVTSLVLTKLVTWMRRQSGHHRSPGPALHGRSRRLSPADRQSAHQEADHDVDEAGSGVRRRRGPLDPEPGRHRLQGAVERRYLDDRPTLDGAGQGTSARRPHVGRRERRHRGRRRHDLRPRQARVRAARARQRRDLGVHDPLGDELPPRSDDPRPDQPRDDGRARRAATAAPPAGGDRGHTSRFVGRADSRRASSPTTRPRVMPDVADGTPGPLDRCRRTVARLPSAAIHSGPGSNRSSSPACNSGTTRRRPISCTTRSTNA